MTSFIIFHVDKKYISASSKGFIIKFVNMECDPHQVPHPSGLVPNK